MNFLKNNHRKLLVAYGDKHAGHTFGLMNPETKLKDRDGNYRYPQMTEAQNHLWRIHTEHFDNVLEFADGDDICLIDLGDVTQGKIFATELVSTKMSDQFAIGYYAFLPWLVQKNVKNLRLTIGTAIHTYGEGSAEDTIEERIKGNFPQIDTRTLLHGLLTYNGTPIDYAHHGPTPGSRNWLHGNEARYYLRSMMWDELGSGNYPPALVLRAHYHTFVEEFLSIRFDGKRYRSWLYVLPSYCLLGEYAAKKTKSQYQITNGMLAIETIDGRLGEAKIFDTTLDIRTKEEIA